MSRFAANFFVELRKFLLLHGPEMRAELRRFYQQKMGKHLFNPDLSRWLTLRQQPKFDSGIVLLTFAYRHGLIVPETGGEKKSLFVYAEAEPVIAKRKVAARELARYAKAGRAKKRR